MKKNYAFYFLLTLMLSINMVVRGQTTELFEDETIDAVTFSENGQIFNVTSTSTDTYDINESPNGGWNALTGLTDDKFLDNYGFEDANNESSFTITTNNGTEIIVSSLYLFISTNNFTNPTSGTLTINGKLNGVIAYTITKTSGFADVVAFDPNSGYTFIDFTTEGPSDYSVVPVDELEFITDGDMDYMGLDSFTWDFASTLSINGYTLNKSLTVFPNPATNQIKISNLRTSQSFEIFNVLGNRISKGIVAQNESINIQDLSNGLYIIRMDNGNSLKFIKK